jgi:hypothetical protein
MGQTGRANPFIKREDWIIIKEAPKKEIFSITD